MALATILNMLQTGGPWAVATLAVFGLCWERKESKRKDDKILELAVDQVETIAGIESAVTSLEKVLAEVLRRM